MASDGGSADSDKKPDTDTKPKAVEPEHDDAGATGATPAEGKDEAAGDQAEAAPPSLGERQVQAKSAVGPADDPAEKAADATADRVLRMPEPAAKPEAAAPGGAGPSPAGGAPAGPAPAGGAPAGGAPAGASPAGAAGAAPGAGGDEGAAKAAGAPAAAPQDKVQRATDPAAEKRPESAAGAGSAPTAGAGPAPAGPAPAPAGAGAAAPGATDAPAGGAEEPAAAAAAEAAGAAPPSPESEPPAPEGEQPARSAPEVPEATQTYLDASAGNGKPLPEKARKYFETRMNRDLGNVGIHDDAASDEAAKAIDALAFTRGNDIYFRAGAYDPEGEAGKKLLAHELAHVVQQRPGINRKPAAGSAAGTGSGSPAIRRKDGDDKKKTSMRIPDDLPEADKKKYPQNGPAGTIDTAGTLQLDKVYVPAFKKDFHTGALTWNKKERGDAYRAVWTAKAAEKLKNQVPKKAEDTKQKKEPHYFQRTAKILTYGTADDIANALSSIPWSQVTGSVQNHQIDHQQEFQLGGAEEDIGNLWLLRRGLNTGSGGAIMNSIHRDIGTVVGAARKHLVKPPTENKVKKGYTVTFGAAAVGPNPLQKTAGAVWSAKATQADWWKIDDLGKAAVLTHLEKMTKENKEKIRGSEDKLTISTRKGGGSSGTQHLPYDSGTKKIDTKKLFLRGAFKAVSGTYDVDTKSGSMLISFFDGNAHLTKKERTFDIQPSAGIDYGGFIDTSAIRSLAPTHTKASPVELGEVDFDFEKGIVGRGKIPKPTIPLLENVEIAVILDGEDIGLEAVISGGDLKLPGPFSVQGGIITLTASAKGISVEGDIEFEIEKLAKGKIGAGGSTKSTAPGFAVKGSLDFDTKMFTQAHLGLSYTDGKWGVEGTLAVGANKIKGIKSASATVTVDDGNVDASGEFETSIKGIDKGKVGFRYDPATGMEITGMIELGAGIPGIKSGTLDATVKEGAEGWSLSGGITVEPSVPGLTGSITGRYDDGAFLVEADLGYERGIAKGRVKVGLTNQAVTEGKPSGPPMPDGALTAYGGGEVTLTITPWLIGTVGLQLLPNGQIEVKGKVALPDHFDVFPEKKVAKRVFSIGIDIPIVGVAVAGQRIGIFATIRGGLDVSAGFGPGQLKGVALEVTYNPDDPGATHVVGTGTFAVPAQAGLRLTVDGGLGAGIPVVSATAGVSIYGEVGVQGEASASASIDWSPGPGFVLDAKGELSVSPRFKFGIDAFVDVSADLYLTTVEIYKQTWNLASFEYGSDMKFGLTFPIHYEQGKEFDLSFDQIQWTYPTIEPGELLGGLMKQLVG